MPAPVPPAATPDPPLRRSGRSGRVVVHPWPSPAPGNELPGPLCRLSRAARQSGEPARGPPWGEQEALPAACRGWCQVGPRRQPSPWV